MATQVFFRSDSAGGQYADVWLAYQKTLKSGSASAFSSALALTTGRGNGVVSRTTNTIAGPTNGIEAGTSGGLHEWLSAPIDADVTISGTITINLWANESSMSANATIGCKIERVNSQGAIVSTIYDGTFGTELTTSSAAKQWTPTPTSTNMLKGDRFRVTVYYDDASGVTMAATYNCTFSCNGSSAGNDGDSYITFNETFGFLTTDPTGSTLYLTDTAGPAVGSQIEKALSTSRGAGLASIAVTTQVGWVDPVQWTDSGGGTAVEWYSKRLITFTLDGLVYVKLDARENNTVAQAGLRAELAICDSDGSNAVVWGAANFPDELPTSALFSIWRLSGDATTVNTNQRLRLRIFIDDLMGWAQTSSWTCTLRYGATVPGNDGDSYITLPQTITELEDDTYQPRHAAADSGLALV